MSRYSRYAPEVAKTSAEIVKTQFRGSVLGQQGHVVSKGLNITSSPSHRVDEILERQKLLEKLEASGELAELMKA